jgi:hypothetical protein
VAPELAVRHPERALDDATPDLSLVFHRLNNQLGVILANAELLEARLTDDTQRARAGLVVSGALDAISTVQDLRRLVGVGVSNGR